MKSFLLICFAFCCTFNLMAGSYDLVSVPHKDIDGFLVPGSDATNTPEALQGLWFMDGNPLADEVISFASARFEPYVDAEGNSGYKALVPVYDEGIWTWHDNAYGRLLYGLVLKSRLEYLIEFNEDFSEGQVTPTFDPLILLPSIVVPPSMLVDFELNKVAEDEYARDSIILGQVSTYRFRRIVDGEGRRLPAYEDYVASILERGPINALIPICRKGDGDTLPTRCAF
ncbi:MAG: hypothetical protein HRU19_15680 [Pseudobacteriovorax sp.]|nr:hypothetical protein [Pseudobacteriovorax sp.]